MKNQPIEMFPALVAHADWGVREDARWVAVAIRDNNGIYHARPPEPVGDLTSFFQRLRGLVGGKDSIFVGFDFPIGLPKLYAGKVGVDEFLEVLPVLGKGQWSDFYDVADDLNEVSLKRPFYPNSSGKKGEKKQVHLMQAHGVQEMGGLRRQCEHKTSNRRAAQSLFWTLGGNQVGKGAIAGWRDLIGPALKDASLDISIWPFSGYLSTLFSSGKTVITETYPAEFYSHLGVVFTPTRAGEKTGKTVQSDRAMNEPILRQWVQRMNAAGTELMLNAEFEKQLEDGFGDARDGEDRFDAAIGLFGMLNILLGHHTHREPVDEQVRNVEGWILGQGGG